MAYYIGLILIVGACIICVSFFTYHLIANQLIHTQYRRNLTARITKKVLTPQYEHITFLPLRKMFSHIHILLSSSNLSLRVQPFFYLSFILLIIGCIIGRIYFSDWQSIVLCSLLFFSLPYIVIRAYLVTKRMEAQREFLPAVELFYQYYLITGGRQIKLALAKTIEEQALMPTMQQNFTQLHRNLTVYPDIEYSLTIFNHATGHRWARYFTQVLMIALNEGISIKGGLKDLIDDMRHARKANELERHRLLEIRIANFTPLLFLCFFIGLNLWVNTEQTIQAYVYDESGRKMILNAIALIIVSLFMGIHLSRKRMG